MGDYIIGLAIGLLVGVAIGIVIGALLNAARDGEQSASPINTQSEQSTNFDGQEDWS